MNIAVQLRAQGFHQRDSQGISRRTTLLSPHLFSRPHHLTCSHSYKLVASRSLRCSSHGAAGGPLLPPPQAPPACGCGSRAPCAMVAPQSGAHPGADYLAGVVAGSANIVVGFPADTVKVRLQNRHNPYSGALHCLRSMLRNEGVTSLYRGMSPQLVGGALETGVNYAVYQAALAALQGPDLALPPAAAVPLSAAAAGAVLSLVLSPAELVKCRLQLASTERYHSYAGPVDCLRQTVQAEGLRGLTRGLGATMAREIPGNAVYFSCYALLRQYIRMPGRPMAADDAHSSAAGGASSSSSSSDVNGSGVAAAAAAVPAAGGLAAALADAASAVVCGGLAGMVMWAAVLPLDVAKTRIQTAHPGSYADVGVLRQLHMVYREGGLRALYAGLSPTLARAFPANAAQWLAWELCLQHMRRSGGAAADAG